MAFFNPLGALSAAGAGAVRGATEDAPKIYDLMGMQALGRAFQMPQQPPTIAPIPGIGQQGPQPPPPGQSSAPAAGPPPPGPSVGGGGPPSPFSGGGGGPVPPGFAQAGQASGPQLADAFARLRAGQGQPMGGFQPQQGPQPAAFAPPPQMAPQRPQMAPPQPQGPPPGMQQGGGGPGPQQGPPGQQQGMPQLDLQSLISRINQANPGLPPQAMVAALTRAAPLLNVQGRQELMMLRQQMQAQQLELRRDRLDFDREKLDDARRAQKPDDSGNVSGFSPQAVEQAAEHFINTGQYPPGLRDRQGGNALRSAIANRAAEIVQDRNLTAKDVDKRRQEFKAEQTAITRFMSGPQGNTVRSLGVVVDHLTTMRELAVALQNNDVQAFNRIANAWAQQFGVAAPTNVNTAAQIVGAEVIKALGVAGAGTKEERQEAGNAFGTAKSPEQLVEAIDKVVKPLMLGQLKGLRRQFKVSTGLKEEKFDALLGDEAQQFFGGAANPPTEGSARQRGGGGDQPDPLGIR